MDLTILGALLRDGRTKFADIAKECQVSKNAIWKHYDDMRRAGIIKGSTVQINYPHFGFKAYATIIASVETENIEQIVKKMRQIPNVYVAMHGYPKYSINIGVALRDIEELDSVKEKIRRVANAKEVKSSIWIGVRNIFENIERLSQGQKIKIFEDEPKIVNAPAKEVKLDKIDMEIVERLAKDGRMSFRNIALEIGKSTDTITKRYQKLRRNNTIKVVVQFDPTKIGYKALQLFSLSLSSRGEIEKVVNKLTSMPDVTHIMKVSGEFDLLVFAFNKDIEELLEIQNQIAHIEGLTRVEMKVGKMANKWPMPKQYTSIF
ncbi:MAG: Lrp/AsnC family transcriptional regulator [Candidatus Bathyarchaeota archaeon]|nr:Lrp/AsnC family transcriptional regulator [Candidatus Bathyarchaeota archaeon]